MPWQWVPQLPTGSGRGCLLTPPPRQPSFFLPLVSTTDEDTRPPTSPLRRLDNNAISSIPAGLFDGLSALTEL